MRPLTRAVLTGAFVAAFVSACAAEAEAPRINDAEFVAQAERLCARELPPLRADISDDAPREPSEIAPTVRARADSLEALVAELRQIPVQSAARPQVEAWLEDWEEYVDVGRRYAAALREGDPERYSAVAVEGEGPQARISAFARTNGFSSCALDGVPLPPREGL